MVSPNIVKNIPIAIGIKPDQPTTFTNKTIDCGVGNGNVISNIPNSSLVNSSITINGQSVSLGGSTSLPNSITINGQSVSLGGSVSLPTLPTRASVSDTVTVGANSSANIDLAIAKTYGLLKIETSHASWVRLYIDGASRTADGSRLQGVDPSPSSGVIAEIITTGAENITLTPATIGWNNDSPVSSNVYLSIKNLGASAENITVTLTYIQLEA